MNINFAHNNSEKAKDGKAAGLLDSEKMVSTALADIENCICQYSMPRREQF